MNINEQFPSKYLKASDLGGKKHRLTMAQITTEEMKEGGDRKPVLYFDGKEKGLVLNKTNAEVIASQFSPETDGWIGGDIVLYSTKVTFNNQMVDALRVELVTEEAGPDDDIPF